MKKKSTYNHSDQIFREILLRILDDNFNDQNPLPSIKNLAKSLNVSIEPVQQAIHKLNDLGIVESIRGKGTFVISKKPKPGISRDISFIYPGSKDYINSSPWPNTLFKSLAKALKEFGYNLIPVWLDTNLYPLSWVNELSKKEFAAHVLLEIPSDFLVIELKALHRPIISLDQDLSRIGIPSIVFDNTMGTLMASNHLIDLGHQEIAYFQFKHKVFGHSMYRDVTQEERFNGYRLAMQLKNFKCNRIQFKLRHKVEKQYLDNIISQVLGKKTAPTAFVVPSSSEAQYLIEALSKLGYDIPNDISLISLGQKNHQFKKGHSFTTIFVDYDEMALQAMDVIRTLFNAKKLDNNKIIIPTKILPGQSSIKNNQIFKVAL